jgi:polygalacturonase
MENVHASLFNGGVCLQMGPPDPNVGDQCAQWKTLSNVTLTGGGTIDGNGAVWWGNTSGQRPTMFGLLWIDGLTLRNLTLLNTPMLFIHPIFSKNIEMSYLYIWAPPDSPNTGAICPDSSTNVYIHDCIIDVGDDCITLKSGKDLQGRQIGIPTTNVLIERMDYRHGHGVAIGSEMSGGIRNVTMRNSTCNGTSTSVRIKTCRGRGGVVEDIYYYDFNLTNVNEGINVNMYYCDNGPTNVSATPIFRNIHLSNIKGTAVSQAGEYKCLPESPCIDLILTNISVTGSYKTPNQCEYAYGTATNIFPESCLLPEFNEV